MGRLPRRTLILRPDQVNRGDIVKGDANLERRPPMSRGRRILYPTDFSKGSGAAFKRAIDLAKAERAQLLLVHALAPVVHIAGEGYITPQLYDGNGTTRRSTERR